MLQIIFLAVYFMILLWWKVIVAYNINMTYKVESILKWMEDNFK
jgi:hypothetical protein